jgi:hypothetical protein
MTVRKVSLPSRDYAERFEALALAMIEQSPTATWKNAIPLWRGLPSVRSYTRDRILRRMLEVAVKRGDPWSAKLVERFAEAAILAFADTKARGRVHDAKALQLAARYKAHHPDATAYEIAKAVGVKSSTVRQWPDRRDFQQHRKDEEFLIELERHRIAGFPK